MCALRKWKWKRKWAAMTLVFMKRRAKGTILVWAWVWPQTQMCSVQLSILECVQHSLGGAASSIGSRHAALSSSVQNRLQCPHFCWNMPKNGTSRSDNFWIFRYTQPSVGRASYWKVLSAVCVVLGWVMVASTRARWWPSLTRSTQGPSKPT